MPYTNITVEYGETLVEEEELTQKVLVLSTEESGPLTYLASERPLGPDDAAGIDGRTEGTETILFAVLAPEENVLQILHDPMAVGLGVMLGKIVPAMASMNGFDGLRDVVLARLERQEDAPIADDPALDAALREKEGVRDLSDADEPEESNEPERTWVVDAPNAQ